MPMPVTAITPMAMPVTIPAITTMAVSIAIIGIGGIFVGWSVASIVDFLRMVGHNRAQSLQGIMFVHNGLFELAPIRGKYPIRERESAVIAILLGINDCITQVGCTGQHKVH